MAVAVLALMAVVAALWSLWPRLNRAAATQTPARPAAGRAAGFIPAVPLPTPLPAKTERIVVGHAHPTATADLIWDGKTPLESCALQPGQRVHGAAGKRPMVAVPAAGLLVATDGVCFEDIDFVWSQSVAQGRRHDPAPRRPRRISPLHVLRRRSRRSHSARRHRLDPSGGRSRGGHGLAQRAVAAPRLRVPQRGCGRRLPHARRAERGDGQYAARGGGSGPAVGSFPTADEPLSISLDRVTLRGTGPLLQCGGPRRDDRPHPTAAEPPPPGEISVRASGCVLAPGAGQALLLLAGRDLPANLLTDIQWTGQGSLVLSETPIAAWRRPDGSQQVLDESRLSMAGLVRGTVVFAGRAEDGPSGSQVLHWQAPSQSSDPPGVDADALPRKSPALP